MLVQMFFDSFSAQKLKTISAKKFEPSTSSFTSSQRIPRPQGVSPPISSSEAMAVFALRIHGRLRLEEPLDHGIVASLGCQVQRCLASGAAARGQGHGQNPTERRGEKFGENLGTSKVEVLESVATQKSSLDLRNNVVLRCFEMFSGCFDDVELV